jgi:hypothetical protein
VTGGAEPGSVLTCSDGSWAPDLPGSFVYRAPARLAYRWSLNGADVAGATANVHTASAGGEYRCTVVASNFAGDTPQESAPHTVVAPQTDCIVPDVVGQTLAEATGSLEGRVAASVR